MNVRELIQYLSDMDPEAKVHFSYNYGDYWRTIVAPEVKGVDEGEVTYSEYHRMHRIADDDNPNADTVVILR